MTAYVLLANGDLSTQALVDAAKAAKAAIKLNGLTVADQATATAFIAAADAKVAAAEEALGYATTKAAVESKVEVYVPEADGDLTTQSLVDAAKAAKEDIDLTGLKEADQSTLQAKVDAAQEKVAAAEKALGYTVDKAAAESKVESYVTLADGDLTTQALVDAAKAAKGDIDLTGLKEADQSTLQAKVDAAAEKVAAAEKALGYAATKAAVESKVEAYVALANGDLTTQALVDAVKAAKGDIDLTGLKEADQSTLQAKVDAAAEKVAAAEKALKEEVDEVAPTVAILEFTDYQTIKVNLSEEVSGTPVVTL